jgi:hypothetical protein
MKEYLKGMTMKAFTEAGRSAIRAKNYYSGLSLALMMPDICGSIEDTGPGTSKIRYEKWCKAWFEPKYTHRIGQNKEAHVFIAASDVYQLRCSLIHSGRADIADKKVRAYKRFEFFDDTTGSHCCQFGGQEVDGVKYDSFIQLKAENFSMDMFDAVDAWYEAKKEAPDLRRGINSAGAVIGAVQIG